MRYWIQIETGKLLRIDVQMAPIHWMQITKEEYEAEKEKENVRDNLSSVPSNAS